MQVIQKVFIEVQEIIDNNKIKTGHFWFQGNKYNIVDGVITKEGQND